MKPRTKLQFRVVDLAKNIKPLTEIQEKWAYDECLEHIGYANKSRVICMDCGNTFSLSLVSRKKAVCPHCNTKLSIEITQKRTYEQRNYFAKTEIIEDFQVVRNFELFSYHKKDKPVKYFLPP